MVWKIFYHPNVEKQLKRLHKTDQRRIIKQLKFLSQNPESKSSNVTKLTGTRQSFRLRIGKIRIIFEKETKNKAIYIWRIKYRKDIYRK